MRTLKYLSPTSLATWIKSEEEFYLRYLATTAPPRMPQTDAMSVGSAFDAYVKSFIQKELFGTDLFESLFEAQVEKHNRTFALEAGRVCMEAYTASGALADLMTLLVRSGNCRFEFTVSGAVSGGFIGTISSGEDAGLVLLGKPDAFFTLPDGRKVILDWKVNGYCSKWGASPKPGYIGLCSTDTAVRPMHKECMPVEKDGVTINAACFMDDVWARQLAIYSWLCGAAVGSSFMCMVDQLVCRPGGNIKVAQHRCMMNTAFQEQVYAQAVELWNICSSGWIFRDMVEAESLKRQSVLDQQSLAYGGDSDRDRWFQEVTKG